MVVLTLHWVGLAVGQAVTSELDKGEKGGGVQHHHH